MTTRPMPMSMPNKFALNPRMRNNPNYLEDVMENNYYSSCKPNKPDGSQSDRVCDKTIKGARSDNTLIFDNPTNGYKRTWGGTQITLNNNINDPMFSQTRYNPINNSIIVPYSATFNRLP